MPPQTRVYAVLRVRVLSQIPQTAVLAVDGEVAEGNVPLLAAELERHLAAIDRLILDLDGVPFIDEDGLALLRRWPRSRLVLRGGSPFVRALLDEAGLAP